MSLDTEAPFEVEEKDFDPEKEFELLEEHTQKIDALEAQVEEWKREIASLKQSMDLLRASRLGEARTPDVQVTVPVPNVNLTVQPAEVSVPVTERVEFPKVLNFEVERDFNGKLSKLVMRRPE